MVLSQTGKGTYRVILAPQGDACPCEDFQLTQKPCKHIHAARLVARARPRRQSTGDDWTPCRSGRPTRKCGPRTIWHKTRRNIAFRSCCRPVPWDRGTAAVSGSAAASRTCARLVLRPRLKVYTRVLDAPLPVRPFRCARRGLPAADVPSMKICGSSRTPAMTPILKRLIVLSSLPLEDGRNRLRPGLDRV